MMPSLSQLIQPEIFNTIKGDSIQFQGETEGAGALQFGEEETNR